jgi:eukaryotic-like serine/threonine-protein kinase
MPLSAGTRLGPYEIVSFIGAGGMGEVYKARDLRLQRDVALKLLPPSFADDPDRLRRFEQEARAVASLSHPNILAVHDIGQHEGSPYLVSELLEGEPLRLALARGALSSRRAVDYAVQIVQGLAAAHSKGIAHRDLKPDNLFITREGRVKILDFGLAKAVPTPADDQSGRTATISAGPATEMGLVVGTAGYMSPEQVRGRVVDARTDIFSFGAVFYEMLTGQRAFKRDTTADTMAAILNDDLPELPEPGHQIPPVLDRIVRHCLEKAPEQRFQSARDLAFDLESLSTSTGSASVAARKAEPLGKWWYTAIGVVALMVTGTAWRLIDASRPAAGSQFHQLTYRRGVPDTARFTPDGQNVIYTAHWESSEPELYTVPANSSGGHPVGISNARLLAVSRKGEFAVALAPTQITTLIEPGTLARTSDLSGAPKPEVENIVAADYTPDGSGLAIVRYLPSDYVCQVEFPIGKVLFREQGVGDLRFSPDGRYLAFITYENPSDDRGALVILRRTGEKIAVSPIFESLEGLAWSPSGNEVWATSPLESGDIHSLSLSGKIREPLAVAGRLFLQDISPTGQLLVRQGVARRGMVIAHGNTVRDLSWLDFGYLRDISYDGKTVLFEEEGSEAQNYTVFVRDVDGSPALPIGEGYAVVISRDKRWALSRKVGNPGPILLLPIGAGQPRQINPPKLQVMCCGASFLSDNRRIVYVAREAGRPLRAWMQDITGGDPQPITDEGVIGWMVSPDDKWLIATRDLNTLNLFAPVSGGKPQKIAGLKSNEQVLGWTADGEIFVGLPPVDWAPDYRVDKLNPHTGARKTWRDLQVPAIGGIFPDPPIITPDGATFGFDYRLRLWDLYTVNGVR